MRILPHTTWSAAPLVSLALLGGIWLEWRTYHLPVGDAAAYHARVREVADQLPYRIGDWIGSDEPVPASAEKLLKPNVLRARRFRNASTGEEAALIVVQCRSARDMGGHYPPICYPAHGWTLRGTESQVLDVAGTRIPVAIYDFTSETLQRFDEKIVYNFFVRPDGTLESGRDGVARAAADPRQRIYGAAQIQVEVPPSLSAERRSELVRRLLTPALPLIEAIRHGGIQ